MSTTITIRHVSFVLIACAFSMSSCRLSDSESFMKDEPTVVVSSFEMPGVVPVRGHDGQICSGAVVESKTIIMAPQCVGRGGKQVTIAGATEYNSSRVFPGLLNVASKPRWNLAATQGVGLATFEEEISGKVDIDSLKPVTIGNKFLNIGDSVYVVAHDQTSGEMKLSQKRMDIADIFHLSGGDAAYFLEIKEKSVDWADRGALVFDEDLNLAGAVVTAETLELGKERVRLFEGITAAGASGTVLDSTAASPLRGDYVVFLPLRSASATKTMRLAITSESAFAAQNFPNSGVSKTERKLVEGNYCATDAGSCQFSLKPTTEAYNGRQDIAKQLVSMHVKGTGSSACEAIDLKFEPCIDGRCDHAASCQGLSLTASGFNMRFAGKSRSYVTCKDKDSVNGGKFVPQVLDREVSVCQLTAFSLPSRTICRADGSKVVLLDEKVTYEKAVGVKGKGGERGLCDRNGFKFADKAELESIANDPSTASFINAGQWWTTELKGSGELQPKRALFPSGEGITSGPAQSITKAGVVCVCDAVAINAPTTFPARKAPGE